MKQRFGAVLCMLLGSVMIANGLGGTSDATAGLVAPTCGQIQIGTPAASCPTGTITFTETTVGTTAPGPWTVTITSSCLDPDTGNPVNMTVSVPDGGTQASGALYIYPDQSGATTCSYAYSEDPAPLYNTAFAPASPGSITYNPEGPSNLDVALTNTFVPPTSATNSSPTSAPSTSSSASVASEPPVSLIPATSGSAGAGAVQLSNTGPRSQVRATLWIGIAVFLFGVFMLFLGRRPQGARSRK